jgi:hypothetical protein
MELQECRSVLVKCMYMGKRIDFLCFLLLCFVESEACRMIDILRVEFRN